MSQPGFYFISWSPINSLSVFLCFTHWYYNSFEIKAILNEKKLLSSYQNFLPYKLDNLDESAVVCASVCAQSWVHLNYPPKNCISHSRPPLPFPFIKKILRNTSKPNEGRRDYWARALHRAPPLPFTLCVRVREPLRQSEIGFSVVQLGGAVGKI